MKKEHREQKENIKQAREVKKKSLNGVVKETMTVIQNIQNTNVETGRKS